MFCYAYLLIDLLRRYKDTTRTWSSREYQSRK